MALVSSTEFASHIEMSDWTNIFVREISVGSEYSAGLEISEVPSVGLDIGLILELSEWP